MVWTVFLLVGFHEIANVTSGSVGADLENIINEAALTAVRKGRRFVCQNDILESIEVVFAGKEKKNNILSADEKSIVAFHEAGHALLSVLQKNTMPVQKITIVPRTKGSLGYVWQAPEEEKNLETKAELEADIVIAVGGRAAEALKFPSVTNGASNDIEQATRIARTMVTMYGMSERFGMVQLEGVTGEYLDRRRVLECSDETATLVDEEVKTIINNAYARAYKLLSDNIEILDAVATFLIDHETITGKEFMDIYNQITGGVAPQIDNVESLTSSNNTAKATLKTLGEESISKAGKAGLKVGEKLKEKLKKQKKKKAKEDKAAEKAQAKATKSKDKVKDKYKVYVSPEFEAKRNELLKDEESYDVDADNVTEQLTEDMAPNTDTETVESAKAEETVVEVESAEAADTETTTEESSEDKAAEKPKMPWESEE